MELIIGIVVGIIIGLIVGTLIFRRRYIPIGDLRIDRSDPTSEPFLFLELGTDVRTMNVEAATVDCGCIEVLRGQQKEGL